MSSIIKPPKTISEQVLEALEKDILTGFYRPGDRMVETEIAGRLGVSRGPVREALLALERRGLIQEKNGNAKGREVISLDEGGPQAVLPDTDLHRNPRANHSFQEIRP